MDALDIAREHRERQEANARIVKAQRELPPFVRWVDGSTFLQSWDWDNVRRAMWKVNAR